MTRLEMANRMREALAILEKVNMARPTDLVSARLHNSMVCLELAIDAAEDKWPLQAAIRSLAIPAAIWLLFLSIFSASSEEPKMNRDSMSRDAFTVPVQTDLTLPPEVRQPMPWLTTNAAAAKQPLFLRWSYYATNFSETFEIWSAITPDWPTNAGAWSRLVATNRGPFALPGAYSEPIRLLRVRSVSADGTTFSGGTSNYWPLVAE